MIDNNLLLIIGASLLFFLILVAAAFIGAMTTIKGWIRDVAGVKETSSTEITGQPITVEFSKHYVTREEFERDIQSISDSMALDRADNKREHENLFSKLGGQERGIQANLRELGNKVAALDERTLTTNSTLTVTNTKIDRILERLSA